MPIILNRIERMNPLTKAKKWYAALKTVTQVKESAVAKQIADETTLNRKEAEMAMAQLGKRKHILPQVQLYTPASSELYSRKYKFVLLHLQSYTPASVNFCRVGAPIYALAAMRGRQCVWTMKREIER